jgi:hypothetical protein
MKKENGKLIHSASLPYTFGILFLESCVQCHRCIRVDLKVLRSGDG